MMVKTFLFLVAFCQTIIASKPPACRSDPFYKGLAGFSKIPQVSSFCVQKFPPKTDTTTITTTTKRTSLATKVITTTKKTTSTVTSTKTKINTVTIPAAVKAKRHNAPTRKPTTKAKPTTTCKELRALKALASSVVATACSCINTTPTITATRTVTLTVRATTLTTTTNIRTALTTKISTTTLTTTTTVPKPPDFPSCNKPSEKGCQVASPCGGGNVESCICEQTIEGVNLCIDEGKIFSCPESCTSSSQCQPGYSCITTTCCSDSSGSSGACFLTATSLGNECTNADAVVIRALKGKAVPAAIGWPLHMPAV